MAAPKTEEQKLREWFENTAVQDDNKEHRRQEFLTENESFRKFIMKHKMVPEFDEVMLGTFDYETYPKPLKKYRLIMTEHEESLEGMYYWMMESYRQDWGYTKFHKVTDVFAASEQSAFFGVSQQRLGLQQDKVSQYLAAIGKMIKEIFQFVRELRIVDERLEFYRDTYSSNSKRAESADITLKGIWVDMVQGGSKNPGSIYGLAREVGFTILPDLFFSTRPKSDRKLDKEINKITDADLNKLFDAEISKLDSTVDRLEFNRKVREVLKRKLREYHEWKKMTFRELLTRRKFTLQYFRQHYDIIKMYMSWIKPYLRNIRRFHLDHDKMDSADLVSAFEGSIVEVEFLATKNQIGWGDYHACGLVSFIFRTTPAMNFQQEGYQRGPKHSGKCTITMRAYAWTTEQIKDYIKMRAQEDIDLIRSIDKSLSEAMDALGDDMKTYLAEAGEKIFMEELEARKKAEQEKRKSNDLAGAAEPFLAVFSGLNEIANAFFGSPKKKGPKKPKGNRGAAEGDAKNALWRSFKNYRKAHKMITW